MKRAVLILVVGFLPLVHGEGEGTVIEPAVESVAMFKNGLAVVRSSFQVEQPGDHLWIDPPHAVHGAFFVENAPGMVIRSTTRLMTPDGPQLPSGDLQRDLAGAVVRVAMLGENGKRAEMIRGKVWAVPTPERGGWNTNYATTEGRRYGANYPGNQGRMGSGTTGSWLVMEVDGQRRFLPTDRIADLGVEGEAPQRAKEPRPVMVFSASVAGKVQLTYLTKGMAWMPAYQVDLLAADRVRLRQTAVVRNELMDLEKAGLELISGYPNIKFAHVGSPLSPQVSLAAFFQQISREGGARPGRWGSRSPSIPFPTAPRKPSCRCPSRMPERRPRICTTKTSGCMPCGRGIPCRLRSPLRRRPASASWSGRSRTIATTTAASSATAPEAMRTTPGMPCSSPIPSNSR